MNNNLEDSIARMKALYTYGTVSENKKQNTSTLEYSAKAADGKTYGIVKEFNHWYIKQAANGKEKLAEGYDYIGGYMNKKNYQYDSYANALKNFELKLSSINEAFEGKVNVSTLDPFKKEIVLAEASDKMKNEIARQRQIMYNAGMIMNEAKDYAVKGGAACSTAQPEAETGAKGDKAEGSKDAKAQPEYAGSKTSGVEKKAEPFKENPGKGKDMNESCDSLSCATDLDAGLKKFGSVENGEADTDHNNDPFNQNVNEEVKEWDKGLPGSAGVGEADTDHNNDPFNKNVNEGAEDDLADDNMADDDLADDDWNEGDVDFEDDDEDVDFDDDEDFDFDDDAVDGEVDSLEGDDMADDSDLDAGVEDVDGALEDGEEIDVDESDPESVRNEIERLQGILDSLEAEEGEDMEDMENMDAMADDAEAEAEADADDAEMADDEMDMVDDEMDSLEDDETFDDDDDMFEGKRNFMNTIVESVVKSILAEDELHDFGKHPGYRKKPMDLPPTGEDKNEHGEDWNDESVHSEEPFGKQIGDSSPFNQLVDAVTNDVMYQLKHGVPLDNKKKEE